MQNNMWCGNPTLSPEHSQELSRAAAAFEFGQGFPRQDAEAKAYADYIKKHLIQAAAHHLVSSRSALAAGDHGTAKKHATMLQLLNQVLTGQEVGPQSPEVMAYVDASPKKIRYKSHLADRLLVSPK